MTKTKARRRWYDKNKDLAQQLDRLRDAHPTDEVAAVRGLVDLIKEVQPEILGAFTVPDDIEAWVRRWYDKDPTYWLVFNCLKHANAKLLARAAAFLENRLGNAGT